MLTKGSEVDVAHIYPFSMLSSEEEYTVGGGGNELTFWDYLKTFGPKIKCLHGGKQYSTIHLILAGVEILVPTSCV